jgi:20S proteasome subunit alpha 7
MSSIGTGYDLAASTFSPDGRIFQSRVLFAKELFLNCIRLVEYAGKAVDNGGTAIGLRCKDGVLVCVEKPIGAILELHSSKKRIFNVCLIQFYVVTRTRR